MNIIDLLILSLATWRLSSLAAAPDDDGPWDVFLRFRELVGVKYDKNTGFYYGTNEFSKGISCVWCISVWFGFILCVLYWFFGEPVVWCSLPLALSGGAIIIERLANG